MWQQIYTEVAAPDVEFVAIALDQTGASAPRPFVEAAGVAFPALVDSSSQASRSLGFKVVPNGILVDEHLTVRYRKDGGFSNAKDLDRAAVERFMRGDDPGPSPEARVIPYELGPLERQLVDAHMRHGDLLASLGRSDEAVAAWQSALRLDPENLTIRKPIWAALFPERFHPTIDHDWQKVQREHERAEEIAAGICGPDGCPLPQVSG